MCLLQLKYCPAPPPSLHPNATAAPCSPCTKQAQRDLIVHVSRRGEATRRVGNEEALLAGGWGRWAGRGLAALDAYIAGARVPAVVQSTFGIPALPTLTYVSALLAPPALAAIRAAFPTQQVVMYSGADGLSAAETIALFQRARVVLGPHGAGLSHILFSAPGTTGEAAGCVGGSFGSGGRQTG